jgi:L-alanine-DL-glutamate epimerase-like enolase superfamily enzyme
MKIQWKSYQLKFQYPFTISKGTKTHQPTFVVALTHLGLTGYGEAPAITYYDISTEKMETDLLLKQDILSKYNFNDPGRFWHFLHHLFPKNPFLVAALDLAGWDLFGKMRRQPVSNMISEPKDILPLTDYTIGIDTIEKMVEKMQAKPWPIYKIKLGTDRDIEIVEALRKHTDAVLRIDANAAWNKEEALEKITAFSSLGVEFIEQPLAKDNWEGMAWLYEKSPLPLIADESCVGETDVPKCAGHFHGINIKLTKCSGLTPAIRMIREARKRELKVMAGSMNECTIGSAPLGHLLPLIDYVDMDGPLLLEEDLATGLIYDMGKVSINKQAPGFGIVPNPDLFEDNE